jgi:phosphonate transport system permease protein
MTARDRRIAELRRARPRNRFVRASVALLALLAAGSWLLGGFSPASLWSERGRANAARFLGELRPWPLQGDAPDAAAAVDWALTLWRGHDAVALLNTLAISVAAIGLAGAAGALLSLAAARNLSCPRPFLPGGRAPGLAAVWSWRAVALGARAVLVALRSLPEYVWAFLLLAMLGPSAWPLVLALAMHNTGILGKLSAEVVENVDARAPAALRALGAGRLQVTLGAVYPLTMPRFLLYFFYRWETCVREATVLGMLGMSSLGFLIVDARSRNRYDEMAFHIAVAALLVVAGEIVSGLTRRLVRRA